MNTIRIVAAILDTEKLVLYKGDGNTVEVRQGDPRVQRIIDEVTTPLSTQGWAEVSLEHLDPEANVYREFETLVKGAIRFFRIHKDKLSTLFDALTEETADNAEYGRDRHLAPVSLGNVPSASGAMSADEVAAQEGLVSEMAPVQEAVEAMGEAGEIRDATLNQKPTMREATDQIMAGAKSVTDKDFTTADTKSSDTMIAAVEGEDGEFTIVPGMENLQPQLRHAVKLGTPDGATNFVRRLAAIIGQRKHTIDELLNFMSKGDLPIADDGSIIAYKVLQSTAQKGIFVDCHSKQVKQRIGSYVTQANVDDSRRTECSVGLHIARRGYLGRFSGDVIVLVKIAPEDVIAVPLNEPNKMRARGYHILSIIPVEEHSKLRANGPIEGSEARKLLEMALRGNHIDVIEEVAIGGPKGTEVKAVKKAPEEVKVAKAPKPKKKTAEAEPINVDQKEETVPQVDAKKVSDKVVANKTLPEHRQMLKDGKFAELVAWRKGKKKSWEALGFSPAEITKIERGAKKAQEPAAPAPVAAKAPPATKPVKPEAKVPNAKTQAAIKEVLDGKAKSTGTVAQTMKELAKPEPTRNEKAKALLHTIEKGKTKDIRRQAYQDLFALKKASKVGWMQLGVDNFDAIQAKFEKP